MIFIGRVHSRLREKAAYEAIGFLVAQTGVPSGSCETPQAKACATLRWKQEFD